jgi:inner membrane protein
MDTFTHALSGALIARATASGHLPPGALSRRVAAGFLAAAAPDLDFVLGWLGPVQYLLSHRGVTHSVVLLPVWALLVSWVLAKLLREPGGWRALYGISALGLASHIAGDLITSFGAIVFAPLSDWRAALGTTFIIDLWFTGIIVAGLAASALWRGSRLPAVLASVVLVGYVGFQAVLRERALSVAERYALSLGLEDARLQAHPRPVSPFNWTVFVSDEQAHRYAHIRLGGSQRRATPTDDSFLARLDAAYAPPNLAQWHERSRYGEPALEALARQAWQSPALGFFRWFADLPAYDGMTQGSACLWFADLRFLTPGRDEMPFRFGACRETADSPWRAYQRGSNGVAQALD